jgi:hypothetical protein
MQRRLLEIIFIMLSYTLGLITARLIEEIALCLSTFS